MATFGTINSANPNVLFDPAAAMGAAQGYQRNALLMENAKQDQAAQGFERDANARIALARQFADLPDDVMAAEWGPAVQRMQAAGLGIGIDPAKPPPRERLRQIASSDLTTFQRLQLDERRRASEAMMALVGGGAPVAVGAPGGSVAIPVAAPMGGGGGATPNPPPGMYGRNAPLAEGREAMLAASEAGAQRVGQPLYNPARPQPGSVPGIPGRWDEGLPPPTGRINPNIGGGPAPVGPQVGANGLTPEQTREVAALAMANPTAVVPMMSQMRAQNAAAAERAADNARADAAQQMTLAGQERAARLQAEQLRLQQQAAQRAEQKDQREAGRLPAKVVELVAETEDKLAGLQGARDALAEARKLSPQAYAGPVADLRGRAAATTGFDAASGTATTQFSSVMTEQALGQLRTIFGGNPTEGERKILLDMMASTSMSRAEREALIKRAEDAVAVREQSARQRLTQLRRGDYGDADPNYTAPQSSAPAAKPEAKADPLEGRTITNGTTGQQMIRRNGKWEPL